MQNGGKFYNIFHNKSKISKKIINNRNFTYRFAISLLDKYIANRKYLSILDYGCGVGAMSFYLANKGYHVAGIDISDKAIEVANSSAKELGLTENTEFYTLTEGNKNIESKKFDLILLMEVIEHVREDQKLVRFLANKLKRGGFMIISTPSTNAPLYKLGLVKKFDTKVGHLRRYTPEKLSEMLKNEKLEIVTIKKTEGLIRNSLFLFPILGNFVRFIRGPISDFVTQMDNITIPLFGESNIYTVARKPL